MIGLNTSDEGLTYHRLTKDDEKLVSECEWVDCYNYLNKFYKQ